MVEHSIPRWQGGWLLIGLFIKRCAFSEGKSVVFFTHVEVTFCFTYLISFIELEDIMLPFFHIILKYKDVQPYD